MTASDTALIIGMLFLIIGLSLSEPTAAWIMYALGVFKLIHAIALDRGWL